MGDQDSLPSSAQAEQSRQNFKHLVLDIAWYGVAYPAVARFLAVYAIRLGGSAALLGWLAALPAIMLMCSASLAGWWRSRHSGTVEAVWLPGLLYRFMFLLPAATPFLPPDWQPFWLLITITLPAIPQGISSTLFLVILRQGVESSQLAALMSRRSLVFNVIVAAATLGFGLWLERGPFPFNYQFMFVVAYITSLMSLLHVNSVRLLGADTLPPTPTVPLKLSRSPQFRSIAAITMLAYVAYFSVVPIIPLILIDHLGAGEGFVSAFGLVELGAAALISLRLPAIMRRLGARGSTAIGMAITGAGALVLALAPSLPVTLIAAALSSAAWTLASLGVFNYFIEQTPPEHVTRFSTVYNQIVSLGMFVGPMLGSQLASVAPDLATVMFIGGVLRILAAIIIPIHANRAPWRLARRRAAA